MAGVAPRCGWCVYCALHGHRETITFVVGLCSSGMMGPMVLDGSINRDALQAYIDQVLVLDFQSRGIVIMDNNL